jgi:D-tyrosyl-tRNA(Tyr) deacylase
MRIVLQRVSRASVSVGGCCVGEIGQGVLLLLGIEKADVDGNGADNSAADIDWLVRKVTGLRIFSDSTDADSRTDRSLIDIGGEALVVSQFTLHARTKKGTRPSFDQAATPENAIPRYEKFVRALSEAIGRPVATGEFGAMMEVSLVNDGPVTLVLDSLRRE